MGDLTTNLSRHEVKCSCGECTFTIQDHEPVIGMLQEVVDVVKHMHPSASVTVKVTSGARCHAKNKSVKSNDESQHLRACAIDYKIKVDGMWLNTWTIHKIVINHFGKGGFGVYNTFNHIDSRNVRAIWDNRTHG